MDKAGFYEKIVDCLIEYGKLSSEAARLLMAQSNIFNMDSDEDSDSIFHETPYYWAMWLLYSKTKPDWYQDSKLWPPPKDYLDKWYGS